MLKSILYKEWIKTRNTVGIILLVFLGASIYSFLKINEGIRLSGIVNMWETVLQKDSRMFSYFEYLPLLAGLLLALSQYIPELQSKRLKLTLHLPLNDNYILLTMLLYGVGVTLALLALTLPSLLLGLRVYFPSEIVQMSFQQLMPWFLAGPAAYLITAWICLEPQWKQQLMNAVSGIIFLSLFLFYAPSGAYGLLQTFLVGGLIIAFFFPFYSTIRFKEGVQ